MLVGAPDGVRAQTAVQIPLQFDFINPGAKSKAMGGAFTGLADDATATFANPAGLMLITKSEMSIEARHTRTETPFLGGGRLSGTIFNEGLDTVQGPVFGESGGADAGVGFLSGVYVPVRGNDARGWRIAGYRHELVRVDQSFFSTGVFQKAPDEFTSRREFPQEGIRAVSITGYGVTAAYRISAPPGEPTVKQGPAQSRRPGVDIGASLAVYRFSFDSRFRRFDTIGFLGPANPSVQLGESTQTGRDVAVAPIVAVLVGLTSRARMGVTYRHGPTFTFRTHDGNDPEREAKFRVPDTFSVGASFQPIKRETLPVLSVAGEITRVRYRRLRNDFVTDQVRFVNRADAFSIDSGTEIHGGVQFWPTLAAPQIRGGVWYDPDHSVRFTPLASPATDTDRLFDEKMSAALSTGKNLVHYTGGIGISLGRIEANAAADVTSRSRVLSASLVVRVR
jgi:hypothetical protein